MSEPAVHKLSTDFSSIFQPECVVSFRPQISKQDALYLLVTTLSQNGRLAFDSSNQVAEALIERERFGTTGMGKGLALPHMRSRNVEDFIGAVGVSRDGFDFESLDGQPTRLVILLLSPFEEREAHVQFMGRLATLLSDKTLQYSLQIERSPEELLSFLGLL